MTAPGGAGAGRRPRILHVVGARPNLVKIAPLLRTLEREGWSENVLVHTGQHYDDGMSGAHFRDLGLRPPDVNLGVGSGTHAQQTAAALISLEEVIEGRSPDLVVVVGDVKSTLAGALTAVKLGVPVAHLEAGLRSGDRSMPEEINRIVTDQVAALLLTPSRDADANLRAEGIPESRIRFVGNIMIDSLNEHLDRARAIDLSRILGVPPGTKTVGEGSAAPQARYALVTLHRPSNVDEPDVLREIVSALVELARELPVVFPVHPRTRARMAELGLEVTGVRTLDPVGYREMLALEARAAVVLTDSGGVQEETTVLGVPCVTLRDSTERPVTVTHGTNRLVPDRSREAILRATRDALGGPPRRDGPPEG